VVLTAFAIISLAVADSQSWVQLLVVVAAATGVVALVLRECVRAWDQRRNLARLLLVAAAAWLLPPILLASTYGEFLESRALMRINLMLFWLVLAFVIWTVLDRLRRRHLTLDASSSVSIVIAMVGVAVAILPPLPGLANVGKPLTLVTLYRQSCTGYSNIPLDGERAELETSLGDIFASTIKDGAARFEQVPFFSKTRSNWYLNVPNASGLNVPIGDPDAQIMADGSLKLIGPWTLRDPAAGYTTILASLISGGALEPSSSSTMIWRKDSCGSD
jgi:hypothetical protein